MPKYNNLEYAYGPAYRHVNTLHTEKEDVEEEDRTQNDGDEGGAMDQEDGDSQERSPLPDVDMEGVADDEDVGQSRKRTRLDEDDELTGDQQLGGEKDDGTED